MSCSCLFCKLGCFLVAAVLLILVTEIHCMSSPLWQIGERDHSADEFALAPDGFADFLRHDFGFEDRYFLVGRSDPGEDFPYILPGPVDEWGGTWGTAGWRTHQINILFSLSNVSGRGVCTLNIALADSHPDGSLVKASIGQHSKTWRITPGDQVLRMEFDISCLNIPGNEISITVLEGGWIKFDALWLDAPVETRPAKPDKAVFVRSVHAADYSLEGGVQPLLVDVEHLSGRPLLSVLLDGEEVFSHVLDSARYMLEVPMPAAAGTFTSRYGIFADGRLLDSGTVLRSPQPQRSYAGYVDTMMGAAHSRWMIAPGPWMPFGMVKLSPDNQNTCWQAGYQPSIESIGCFSHIHEWTMSGLSMMPTSGPLQIHPGDESDPDSGYRSRIDKNSESAPLGRYHVHLTDTGIDVDLTATSRAALHRYTFPGGGKGRVMIDLHIPSEYDYQLKDVQMRLVSPTRIEGYSHQLTPRVWSDDADQDYTIHFVIEFSQPAVSSGYWTNDSICDGTLLAGYDLVDAGMFVEFDPSRPVCARVGISPVSISNAALNLETEISGPFGWDFEAVERNQVSAWNELLSGVEIQTPDALEKKRFYTNLYRSFCRNSWSDCNGDWITPDGRKARMENGDVALGGDAFWNTFWNLNSLWNLVAPEWSSRWVRSQLAMYRSSGFLAKGPAGMKYIPVMVAEHEIPLVVSAWQAGIRDFDGYELLDAVVKMQSTPGHRVPGGFVGNRDLVPYLKYHYVPYDRGRFSNGLEYSFDDWCVGQLALSLGRDDAVSVFAERGTWWRNSISAEDGYAHLRGSDGVFVKDFDPFHSGANQHYVEGNAWQLTYFVPQDVPGLIDLIGRDRFLERLEWGFDVSQTWRYNAPNDQYWDYPVVQGNQQSMHFPWLFNWAGRPDRTQHWVRSVMDRYYGYGVANAYLGDEDQGQMSSWFVIAAIGLFQTDGGCSVQPFYELGSPLFPKTVIHLDGRYGRGKSFTIEARGTSRTNKYIRSATLNGRALHDFRIPADELLKGGSLVLEMGPEPAGFYN